MQNTRFPSKWRSITRSILIPFSILFSIGAGVAASAPRGCDGANGPLDRLAGWSRGDAGCRDVRPVRPAMARAQAAPVGPTGDLVKPRAAADVVTGIPAVIASDFDTAAQLEPGWRTEKPGGIPASAAPDVVGAFRFICGPAHVSYDDPVVFPGQPGKSHLHQWFGNTKADADSTYASLRKTGQSTCMNPLNRSAYWMPAMLDGKGHVVRPDYITVYYKRRPASDPECARMAEKGCAALPRGLRYVFGYDMVTNTTPTGGAHFDCDGQGAVSAHFPTIAAAAKGCPAGARLGAIINAPECWDGKRLDSPNHREHMASPDWGNRGYLKCPASHPYAIPAFTMGAWYSVGTARADDWYLSSDEMPGMPRMPGGSTLHADWFGAWDDATMAVWTANCIDKKLNCAAGELGDGRQMRQTAPFDWKAAPRLVPIPPRPAASRPASAS